MKTLLAILLFIPNLIHAKLLFDEKPSFQEELTELKIRAIDEDWGFKDWEEMLKDPDVEVEDYKAFIGARCGGLYQARIETPNQYINGSSLNTKLLAMNELIDKYSLDVITDIVTEEAQIWGYSKKHMYKRYYIELLKFSMKHEFEFNTLVQDREICEKEYEKINSI